MASNFWIKLKFWNTILSRSEIFQTQIHQSNINDIFVFYILLFLHVYIIS